MKNLIKFSFLSILAVSTLVACGESPKQAAASAAVDIQQDNFKANTRGVDALANIKMAGTFSKASTTLDMSKIEQIMLNARAASASEGADEEFIQKIFSNLIAAENKTALTTVNMKVAEEEIENDLFIFSLESEFEQKLTFEMYDEEGFQMAANNTLGLSQGNNYKAINVATIENGNYIVRVKNDEGHELVQKIAIKR